MSASGIVIVVVPSASSGSNPLVVDESLPLDSELIESNVLVLLPDVTTAAAPGKEGALLSEGDASRTALVQKGIDRSEPNDNLLILPADFTLAKGSLKELSEVLEEDPMAAFAMPRTSGDPLFEGGDPFARLDELAPILPRWQFAPGPSQEVVLVRCGVLREFGPLDTRLSLPEALADLFGRVNRCGYR